MHIVCYTYVGRYKTDARIIHVDSETQAWEHVDKCPHGHELKRDA